MNHEINWEINWLAMRYRMEKRLRIQREAESLKQYIHTLIQMGQKNMGDAIEVYGMSEEQQSLKFRMMVLKDRLKAKYK